MHGPAIALKGLYQEASTGWQGLGRAPVTFTSMHVFDFHLRNRGSLRKMGSPEWYQRGAGHSGRIVFLGRDPVAVVNPAQPHLCHKLLGADVAFHEEVSKPAKDAEKIRALPRVCIPLPDGRDKMVGQRLTFALDFCSSLFTSSHRHFSSVSDCIVQHIRYVFPTGLAFRTSTVHFSLFLGSIRERLHVHLRLKTR
jgi:hypothetical protein